MQTIDVQELNDLRNQQAVVLVDVRTPVEFREVHAVGAVNVPLDQLKPDSLPAQPDQANAPVYLICKSGSRSTSAARQLAAAGFSQVVTVDGGTDAWVTAGFDVQRGKKAVSLERQVRIVAGGIALAGSILTVGTGNPYWAGIPGFIGAGLLFAGITDTCGMGMILAKMPWNQCNEECSA